LEGSLLSIDPRGTETIVVPPEFAVAGGQVSTLGGSLQLFSAQNAAFLNSINTPGAATANFTGVSNPLGLSINNAFGRLWPANAPFGLSGIGTSTILDPAGLPLAGAPDPQLGGVFAGDLTPRLPSQAMAGALNAGAVGTALLGHSPDGSTRAVCAVVAADGSIVQEHTGKVLDGFAPSGTINALLGHGLNRGEDENGVAPRLGVLLNYSPTRILYVSEPFENTIAALGLSDDGTIFHVANVLRFQSEVPNEPVDLAPVVSETSDNRWASNTTLNVHSDFYVANRGNNTIVRMTQKGAVVAVRRVRLAGWAIFGPRSTERDRDLSRLQKHLGYSHRPSARFRRPGGRCAGTTCVLTASFRRSRRLDRRYITEQLRRQRSQRLMCRSRGSRDIKVIRLFT